MLRLERFYGAGAGDLGPLPPHVCSLALLPRGSGGYVPPAVRELMEEGSPVYELYKECKVRVHVVKSACVCVCVCHVGAAHTCVCVSACV
jgi:hypothetical protein